MFRFLLWRLLGLLAVPSVIALAAWFLGGGPGRVLRGGSASPGLDRLLLSAASALTSSAGEVFSAPPASALTISRDLLGVLAPMALGLLLARARMRRRRRYVRLRVEAYRTDRASAEALVRMFDGLHKRLLLRWWRRLLEGQPALALEVHHDRCSSRGPSARCSSAPVGQPRSAWLAVACPIGLERIVEAALQGAYPNCRLRASSQVLGAPPTILRLKKESHFIRRVKVLDRFEQEREPPVNRLITVMAACGEPSFVQLAITPTPAFFERFSKHLYKRREAALSRDRREHLFVRDRSLVEDAELRGGLDVQHRPLFFVDLRVIAPTRQTCERIASELRAESAENRLVERGTAVRHGLLGLYSRRVRRGEGNPLPSFRRGVFASTELAALWQMPSSDYAIVPFARSALPLAPAPPGVFRPHSGPGTLRDEFGPVSIEPGMRKQNTAVPGTVEQGKTSYLVATVAEDLLRERCAVIVLDPKGDAAEAAVSLVPESRTCTLLDFSRPTCGFNPMAVAAPADVIADYVVAAMKNLFSDADIRASSDRYLRNAVIAVLAHDRRATLWDAARLLSVGEEGYAYRRAVGAALRRLPEMKEIAGFFTGELSAQLADARSTTTAKLDAPVNKLARLLNSASIKRVLLNDSLRVDFEQVIARREVLVVKGALGAMGAGNTSVLMQLLVGMLDAALARQQDLVAADERVAVALKIDEAPLVLNRGFAETMALKRSAGLETVACWQTDAQWIDRDVREQLDALFAHRVYFATASARDARAAVALTMAEFSDTVRPGIAHISTLGHPDVRLYLPKHRAIASFTTAAGRQPPFIAETLPLTVDHARLALHAARQQERGGHHLDDLRQPHWQEHDAGAHSSADAHTGTGAHDAERRRRPSAAAGAEVRWDLPEIAAESYSELVELDRAQSVRWARATEADRRHEPDELDLEMLVLIAGLRHVLSSQIHRQFNPPRAPSTTQRRLKRLADAGYLERLQFHRRDGGGVPMCCVVTRAARELLASHGRLKAAAEERGGEGSPATEHRDRRLRQARRDIHVAGWTLALGRSLGGAASIRGPSDSVISPLRSSGPRGDCARTPSELRLPGGRTPHDFLTTSADGTRSEAERFETVRPDAVVEAPGLDVLLELDGRMPTGRAPSKLERYDHFLSGWSLHTERYGRRGEAAALVVFVCGDRSRARELARRADSVLTASRAYAGEYPWHWDYPGRESILFAAERDVHEGLLCAYAVPPLPPEVRVIAAHGDPGAAGVTVEVREIALPVRSGA